LNCEELSEGFNEAAAEGEARDKKIEDHRSLSARSIREYSPVLAYQLL